MEELRCNGNKKFGELFPEDETLEVRCSSIFCGAGRGVIILHSFDTKSGKLIGTQMYREPSSETGKDVK